MYCGGFHNTTSGATVKIQYICGILMESYSMQNHIITHQSNVKSMYMYIQRMHSTFVNSIFTKNHPPDFSFRTGIPTTSCVDLTFVYFLRVQT